MMWRRPWSRSKIHRRCLHKFKELGSFEKNIIRSDIYYHTKVYQLNNMRPLAISSRFHSQSSLWVYCYRTFQPKRGCWASEHHKPILEDTQNSGDTLVMVNTHRKKDWSIDWSHSILLFYIHLSCTQNQLCRGHLRAPKHMNHSNFGFSMICRCTTTLADTMNYYSRAHRRTVAPIKFFRINNMWGQTVR